jgi:hypothetical protein
VLRGSSGKQIVSSINEYVGPEINTLIDEQQERARIWDAVQAADWLVSRRFDEGGFQITLNGLLGSAWFRYQVQHNSDQLSDLVGTNATIAGRELDDILGFRLPLLLLARPAGPEAAQLDVRDWFESQHEIALAARSSPEAVGDRVVENLIGGT